MASLLAIVPVYTMAIDFYPQSIGGPKDLLNAITLDGTKVVTIAIKNTDSKSGARYRLVVDGKEVGLTGNIAWQQREKFDIPIKLDEQGVPETHKVCAVTTGLGTINIMQCTYAHVLWVKQNK